MAGLEFQRRRDPMKESREARAWGGLLIFPIFSKISAAEPFVMLEARATDSTVSDVVSSQSMSELA